MIVLLDSAGLDGAERCELDEVTTGTNVVDKRPKDGPWALQGEEGEEELERGREGATGEVGGKAGDQWLSGKPRLESVPGGGRCPVANTADGWREG